MINKNDFIKDGDILNVIDFLHTGARNSFYQSKQMATRIMQGTTEQIEKRLSKLSDEDRLSLVKSIKQIYYSSSKILEVLGSEVQSVETVNELSELSIRYTKKAKN